MKNEKESPLAMNFLISRVVPSNVNCQNTPFLKP